MAGLLVTRQEFDAELERVRASTPRPAEGVFGPQSVTWRVLRDGVTFLGAGRAVLLQLAHPYVAHAVDQHSQTRTDPIGRFNRTFQHVYGMIFGDLETALASARRVRAVHDGVHGPIDEDVGRFARGHRYHAHDAGALRWVFATLVETSLLAHAIGFGPLPELDRQRYYLELRRFARLFGLSDALLPPDLRAFEQYTAAMLAGDELSVGRPAREIGAFLLASPGMALAPAARWYRTLTAGMLTPRLREAFALPWSRADQVAYEGSLALLRRTWRRLPARLRLRPEYVEATRRLAGRPRPDRVGRALQRAVLSGVGAR